MHRTHEVRVQEWLDCTPWGVTVTATCGPNKSMGLATPVLT